MTLEVPRRLRDRGAHSIFDGLFRPHHRIVATLIVLDFVEVDVSSMLYLVIHSLLLSFLKSNFGLLGFVFFCLLLLVAILSPDRLFNLCVAHGLQELLVTLLLADKGLILGLGELLLGRGHVRCILGLLIRLTGLSDW